MHPRRFVLAAFVGAVLMLSTSARAQEYPTKPINLVVPFAPGGPTDVMARTIANHLKDALGQTVIVDNRPGAGGNIGAEHVVRSPADGHTLLFGTSGPLAINVGLYKKMNYHPERDFAPIIQLGYLPNVIAVHPSVPAANVKELIALAKSKPGQLTFASSGNGASSHLAGIMFNNLAGTELVHVPYRGTGPALNDLVGGHVTMTFTDVLTALPYASSGRLKVLGVTTANRSKAMPDMPTVAEQGLAGFDVSVFFGIVAPAATPAPVVAKVNQGFRTILAKPELRDWLSQQGLEPPPDYSPAQLASFIKAEVARWSGVIEKAGAQIE